MSRSQNKALIADEGGTCTLTTSSTIAYVAINIAMEGVTTVASSAVGAGFVKLGLSADGLLFAGGLLKIVNAAKIAYLAKRISWFWDKFTPDGLYKKGQLPITSRQATELAEKLGYRKLSGSYTDPVYYNPKASRAYKYISRDKGSGNGSTHNGGVWKASTSDDSRSDRTGTYNADLSIKIGN